MRCVDDTVHQRVAHKHIGMCHIDFCTVLYAFGIFPFSSPRKGDFPHGTVAPGAIYSRSTDRTACFADLFLCLIIHICETLFDKKNCPLIELLDIIRSIELIGPLKSKPFDILFDGVNILYILFDRIGVIKTEVCISAIF